MKSENSKLVFGLVLGAAIGAAVGALIVSANKEGIMDELSKVADTAKKNIHKAYKEGLEEIEEASERVSKVAHNAIEKVREYRH